MEAINKLRSYLEERFVEREDVIEGCLVALGCKQHILLLGPPGTGKSKLIKEIKSCIEGVIHFGWLMSRFTTPEELYGPVSLKSLEDDVYERITSGKMPECHIAFLDEVFKSSSSIANTNLNLMDDSREYFNGAGPVKTPIMTVFGASNELPEGQEEQELAAFNDRFALRYFVDRIKDPENFEKMSLMSQGLIPTPERPHITFDDLVAFQDAVAKARITKDTVAQVREIRTELLKEGIEPSDRRIDQSYSILRAVAALNGCDEVYEDHLSILANSYWTYPHEKNEVKTIIRKVVNPALLELDELMEEAEEIYETAMEKKDATIASEAITKLKSISTEVDKLCKAKIKNQNLVCKTQGRLSDIKKDIFLECLGFDPSVAAGV